MSTISGTVANGVTFGQAGYTSPLTIMLGGRVESGGTGAAVYASATYANPVVVNHGTIFGSIGYDGAELKDGGSVANTGTGALIEGYNAVYFAGQAASRVRAAGMHEEWLGD